jgi:hypothetical protein
MSFLLSVEVSNPSFVLGIYWTIIQHPEPARVGNSYGVIMIRRGHPIARKDCPIFQPPKNGVEHFIAHTYDGGFRRGSFRVLSMTFQ